MGGGKWGFKRWTWAGDSACLSVALLMILIRIFMFALKPGLGPEPTEEELDPEYTPEEEDYAVGLPGQRTPHAFLP